MTRAYNHRISERANRSLDRRCRQLRFYRILFAIVLLILISTVVLLGSSISAFATATDPKQPVYKYYTSIRVEAGDSVWEIADDYIKGQNVNKKEYVEEICRLNDLKNGQIHSGRYLTVAYYSTEEK